MAFKGKTTAGYKPTTGKQLGAAMRSGKVGKNPSGNRGISGANIVTKATMQGTNPRNNRSQTQNSNRVQSAKGPKTNPKQIGLGKAANQPAASSRGKNAMSVNPFSGYKKLANSRAVPAGKGNIRNAGSVQRTDVARLKSAGLNQMPKGAIQGGGSFKGFLGQS